MYIHTYMHACMHARIHTYIHTYIHIYIHILDTYSYIYLSSGEVGGGWLNHQPGFDVELSMDISRHVHAVGLCSVPKGMSYLHIVAKKE